MYEVEAKFRVSTLEQHRRQLDKDAELQTTDFVVDTYFTPVGTPSYRFRLREGGGVGLVTIKSDNWTSDALEQNGVSLTICREIEFRVDEPAAFREFAAFTGADIQGVVRKSRRVYSYEQARIELNEVTEQGFFIEIEVKCTADGIDKAATTVRRIARILGLSAEQALISRYLP